MAPHPSPVAPLAGAWIETILDVVASAACARVAPLAGAWIETTGRQSGSGDRSSRPPRGGVDRNAGRHPLSIRPAGRPPRGGVDRNW